MIRFTVIFAGIEFPFDIPYELLIIKLKKLDKPVQINIIKELIKDIQKINNDISKVLLNELKKEL
jgi:hypothetical protein